MIDDFAHGAPHRRIYLDNAATSWPKPESVYLAIDHYQRHLGAAAGRSGYAQAAQVNQLVREARLDAARLFNVRDPARVLFTTSGTDSLNTAIHGCLRAGDHVVTSVLEHNSVLRPLRHLEDSGRITVTRVGGDRRATIDVEDIRHAVTPRTRLIVLSHASNVTGVLQPIDDVGRLARDHGILFLVDACQTAGHVPIDFDATQIDLLATSGHKGLLGPLGTGLLLLGPDMDEELESFRQGGTGTQSDEDWQPSSSPEKYESGNLNVPGIVGLGAGLAFLRNRTIEAVRDQIQQVTARLLDGLAGVPGARVLGDGGDRVGVVSISLEHYDPQEVAAALDATYGIQVRAGLHCAPLMHRALGTMAGGGTVRFSLGPFNTDADVDACVAAIEEIASAALPT